MTRLSAACHNIQQLTIITKVMIYISDTVFNLFTFLCKQITALQLLSNWKMKQV